MLDPVLSAHMRILDNLQLATQRALDVTPCPRTFSQSCRSWLRAQLRQLALVQQSTAASYGHSRRVAMFDDMLYALSGRQAPASCAALSSSMRGSIDEMRAIIRGFTPRLGAPPARYHDTACAILHTLEAGPLSPHGALAGLVRWWLQHQHGWIDLDAETRQLRRCAGRSTSPLAARIDAQVPCTSWAAACGSPGGRPALSCRASASPAHLEATDQVCFHLLLACRLTLTGNPPQDRGRVWE